MVSQVRLSQATRRFCGVCAALLWGIVQPAVHAQSLPSGFPPVLAAAALPNDLLLEGDDRLIAPPRPTTVGVFGAVYRPGSLLMEGTPLKLKHYIERAGGVQPAADWNSVFVARANGDVIMRKNGMLGMYALQADVAFIPMRANRPGIWDRIRGITPVFFRLGDTAAAVNSVE